LTTVDATGTGLLSEVREELRLCLFGEPQCLARTSCVPQRRSEVVQRRESRQVVLAKRPVGMVTESCFDVVEHPAPEIVSR
jgi:hypothetical protein